MNQKQTGLRGGVAGPQLSILALAPGRFFKSCQVFPSPVTLFGLFPIRVRLFLCSKNPDFFICYYICDVNEIVLQS